LQSYYYILNNLIRPNINPKDGATLDLNGYVRNVLAPFAPRCDKFNVPRFMWRELRISMEDGRKGLPYAPYLMFVIERVTGHRFDKDGLHTIYKIEKTQSTGVSRAVRCSPSVEDVPESSHSRSSKGKKMKKFGKWIKAIFTTCTYAVGTAYEDRLENRDANQEAKQHARLPPLPLAQSPPRFDDLASLSDIDLEDEDETEEEFDNQSTLGSTLLSLRTTRRTHHTLTTHRQGRAVVSFDDDDHDDGGDGHAVVGGRAAGGDDVDWENI
jgi:hypothetical protein